MIDLAAIAPKFSLGRVVATPTFLELGIDPSPHINRHVRGDWGEVDSEDWETNDDAIESGCRVLSVYREKGVTFWIITEADRFSTCVLLPTDY